jgi:release factor glutamine methyltransferase
MTMLYDDIDITTERGVYHPREDSKLLAEAVEKYAFGKALDLGTGTGIQGIIAALKGCEVTFADINAYALSNARRNALQNNVKGTFVVSDMFDNIPGRFNTIMFNPPYLELEEAGGKNQDIAGGFQGRELIDRFIREYASHVLKDHVVLLLESSVNKYEQDAEKLHAEIVAKSHYFFEDLAVLKFE